jgi:hypothetical protein
MRVCHGFTAVFDDPKLGVVRGSGTGPCREDAHRLLVRCFRTTAVLELRER